MHRLAKAVLLAASIVASSAQVRADNQNRLRLIGTIPLPGITGRLDHMAATPDGRWLYVAALGSNRLLRIDTQTGDIGGQVRGIRMPQGVCYLPKSDKVAAASGGGGDLHFLTGDLRALGIVRDLSDADNVRYDPDANLVYVGYGTGALAVIDPELTVQTATIALDGHPESFQLEHHGFRIFINVPDANEIEVYDRARRVLLNEWKVKRGADNFPMALDEAGKRLFIGTRNPARLVVLETEAGKEIAELSACADADDLFYDASTRLIYLSGGQGCVNVFRQRDIMTYDRVETATTAPGARTSLLVASAHRLYVGAPRSPNHRAEIMVYATPQLAPPAATSAVPAAYPNNPARRAH